MKSSVLLRSSLSVAAAMTISLLFWFPAQAQESRWAAADEATAKSLIGFERQWAEAGCTHSGIENSYEVKTGKRSAVNPELGG
jgi:hypothetical protein